MKICILGAAGNIGQALALLLKLNIPKDKDLELCLYDIKTSVLGITLELNHIPSNIKVIGFTGTNVAPALKNSDIIIIAAGIPRKPGMERADLFNVNAKIILNLIEQIIVNSPNALIGIITNPVNTTVVIASEMLKQYGCYDKNKLFGITTLDIIRANQLVIDIKGKKINDTNVPVVGGHSDKTILPLLSQLKNVIFTDQEIIEITRRIQNAGSEVVKAKDGNGSASLSMAYAATRFCLSLIKAIQGKNNILEYAYIEGDGKYTRFFSQPFLLGKSGVIQYKEIGILSNFEQKILDNIINHLNKDILYGELFAKKYFS
ncbi:malate dehydrogenase [Candidatus Pantoea edessiphila]|uniref:Malate dehydrogenase n=1 Tax=Candidatus Pantoea edessiphila TaxID=2044610 RepID=A0A2P5SZR3_9GAMM|nr:malate dehydrogenase [Candidatus Pantoea edessiphila]PPI87806.1 malate dehydrogenase [Candidatus Pantoea edessiphila]